MYQDKKVIAIIPARAGSKGIENKNLIPLSGIPLIQYTIDAAKKSKYIDEILVTTDGVEIAEFSKNNGAYVPFIRPDEISGDKAKTAAAVFHAVEYLKNNKEHYDSVVLLQATSPFRTYGEIDEAIELYYMNNKSVAAVSPVEENPILMRTLNSDGSMSSILNTRSDLRRQDFEDFYFVNGSIYINDFKEICLNTSFNDNKIAYVSKSINVDIDTYHDLLYAEFLMNRDKA